MGREIIGQIVGISGDCDQKSDRCLRAKKVAILEYVTKKCLIDLLKIWNSVYIFYFWGEHLKNALRAHVVPRKMVGKHFPKV